MTCEAIVLHTGLRCKKDVVYGGTRCKVHTDSIIRHGPHLTQRKELKAVYEKWHLGNLTYDMHNGSIAADDYWAQRIEMTRTFRVSMTELLKKQAEEIHRTGVDPDEEARVRKRQRFNELRIIRQQRILAAIANQDEYERNIHNELGKFAADPQNIHTTIMVDQTKKMIEKIRAVPVPEEYRWNTQSCSKTPGEIIVMCKLTPDAAWQMMSKYANPEPIYDIEEGIYGKVLDSVWQYVLNSPEKDSLIAIVKSELEDNVGMCAQGNLSRICNILSGYMDGVGPQESPAEVLGRLMPDVAKIDDTVERLKEANRVLEESGLPKTEWMKWTSILFSDEIVDVRDGKLVII